MSSDTIFAPTIFEQWQHDRNHFVVVAGPCAIESEEQFANIALSVKACGATALRGGIFKLRTNPLSFQGLGNEALKFLPSIKKRVGLTLISEITDPRQIGDLYELVDIFQVGSRNMYNTALLKELGQLQKPILLKRGFSALIDEWLKAADYLSQKGNDQIILCERGIRTFETKTRNTLDLNSVAYLKKHAPYPVLVDPSHGVGLSELIPQLSLAAAAAGADGLLLEVHNNPAQALSDGYQALTLPEFSELMTKLKPLLTLLGRKLP